jgi:hypothetical protein
MSDYGPIPALVKTYRLKGGYSLLGNALTWIGLAVGAMAAVTVVVGGICLAPKEGLSDFMVLLVVLAGGIGVAEWLALRRLTAKVETWSDHTVRFVWIGRSRTVSMYDITALVWVRPKAWRTCNAWRLEPFVVEVAGAKIRLEAAPWTFCQFAEEVQSVNPRVTLDLPQF